MTAGELIRRELAAGTSQLALAKRLARSDDDADAEVKRWRFVVRRAARGGEPQKANVKRIAEELAGGGVVEPAVRRGAGSAGPVEERIASLERRLEEGLARADSILKNQKQALTVQKSMLDQLQELRDGMRVLLSESASLPSAGHTAAARSHRHQQK